MVWGLGVAVCLLLSSRGIATEIKFQKAGVLVKALDDRELRTLISPVSVEVYEPHEQGNVRYKAVSLRRVLDALYGTQWSQQEELLFTCADGYQPSIPVASILRGEGYLAFEREGSAAFTLVNKLQADEKVDLGPLYLIWDNLKDPSLKADGASSWPYQVIALDFVSFQSRFSAMAPAAKASASVTRGFLEFRKACSNCHRINGVGGEKSIELNYPMNVSEYFKAGFLAQWIDAPQKIRWNSVMPPFNPDHPQRKRAISDIVSYLEHMALHKKAPAASP